MVDAVVKRAAAGVFGFLFAGRHAAEIRDAGGPDFLGLQRRARVRGQRGRGRGGDQRAQEGGGIGGDEERVEGEIEADGAAGGYGDEVIGGGVEEDHFF